MWRMIPPTGARTAWTMRRGRLAVSDMRSEPAFADEDGIAGADGGAERDDAAAGVVGQRDAVALGAGREAAGNRDRAFDAHVRYIGILARGCDLAEDEERPVGFDFDRDRRLADI